MQSAHISLIVQPLWWGKDLDCIKAEGLPSSPGMLVMQHWSAGYVAYFPTYSLGAMYAVQLYKVTPNLRGALKCWENLTLSRELPMASSLDKKIGSFLWQQDHHWDWLEPLR